MVLIGMICSCSFRIGLCCPISVGGQVEAMIGEFNVDFGVCLEKFFILISGF
jgi:hypothetical protein